MNKIKQQNIHIIYTCSDLQYLQNNEGRRRWGERRRKRRMEERRREEDKMERMAGWERR